MDERLILVFDVGASSIRAVAVNQRGDLVHIERKPNAPVKQEEGKDWLIWDFEAMWEKLLRCGRRTVEKVGKEKIGAVVVTTFSDDGAPVDERGRLLYPVISWQCPRTMEIADGIGELIDEKRLFSLTGEQVMRQHTIFRLLWLKRNAPKSLERAHAYVMVPGLFVFRLTGRFTNDPTTADSMMLLDIKKRAYSKSLIEKIGLDISLFPPIVEPGTVAGTLLSPVARRLGLSRMTPVIVGGHDTQFAVFGSGCAENEVALSSGTWEILFLRGQSPTLTGKAFGMGIKNECDAEQGLFDVGQQWIASGALEWIGGLLFGDGKDKYERMINEAELVAPGAGGIMVEPSFLPGSGISRKHRTAGTMLGLTLQTNRGEIYRAFLEGLSFTLRHALENIEEVTKIPQRHITVVGGGSKNHLLNRIRADVLGRPVRLSRVAENTVVGAALFGFIGLGAYRNAREAGEGISFFRDEIDPSPDRARYDELYGRFREIAPRLSWFYR